MTSRQPHILVIERRHGNGWRVWMTVYDDEVHAQRQLETHRRCYKHITFRLIKYVRQSNDK